MTGCYHHQARLTETANLDFKHMNHRDVISCTRGRKQELETRLQETKRTLCTIYLLNQSWSLFN